MKSKIIIIFIAVFFVFFLVSCLIFFCITKNQTENKSLSVEKKIENINNIEEILETQMDITYVDKNVYEYNEESDVYIRNT